MGQEVFVITIATLSMLIIGGVLVVLMGMYQGMKHQEMQHRERMAMIEKGLAPSPTVDPDAFDRWRRPQRARTRATTVGVVIVALGLALAIMIGAAAGAPEIGIGVGGAIAIVGAAFVVVGELQRRSQPVSLPPHGYAAPPPMGPPDRGNVGP